MKPAECGGTRRGWRSNPSPICQVATMYDDAGHRIDMAQTEKPGRRGIPTRQRQETIWGILKIASEPARKEDHSRFGLCCILDKWLRCVDHRASAAERRMASLGTRDGISICTDHGFRVSRDLLLSLEELERPPLPPPMQPERPFSFSGMCRFRVDSPQMRDLRFSVAAQSAMDPARGFPWKTWRPPGAMRHSKVSQL